MIVFYCYFTECRLHSKYKKEEEERRMKQARVFKVGEGEKEQPPKSKTKQKSQCHSNSYFFTKLLCPLSVNEFNDSACVGVSASCKSFFCIETIIFIYLMFYLRDKNKIKIFV